MAFVVNHFKALMEKNSKNGKPFLTEQHLIIFIERAFLKKSIKTKPVVNLTINEKGFFISRFYEFFDLCVSQYGEVNKKKDYISLVTDNFGNQWNRESVSYFFKPNKTKEKW